MAVASFSAEGQTVSGIQFDLESDAHVWLRLLPGAGVGGSAKVLYTSALSPRALRAAIIGMNRRGLPDGELARLVVYVDPGAAAGASQVRITNALATDPDGNAIPVRTSPLTITVEPSGAMQSLAPWVMLNAASFLPGPVSPGEIVTIFGEPALASASSLLINGAPAPLLYAGPNQVNAIVPFALDPGSAAAAELRSADRSFGAVSLPTAPAVPALFTQSADGTGPAVVLNEDYTVNSSSNPAAPNSFIVLYGTGFGQFNQAVSDGQVPAAASPTVLPVTATVAGLPAEVSYAGAAPGLIAGVAQINLRVPAGVSPSDAAPLLVTIGSATTPLGVTVAVK